MKDPSSTGRWLLMAAVVTLVLPTVVPAADFVLVVHPDTTVEQLSSDQAADLFMKRTTTWSDGTPVEAVDQAAGSAVREAFSLAVHGRDTSKVKSYWQSRIFSGEAVPPPEVAGDAEVIDFVRSQPGAVGYVAPDAPLDGVRRVQLVVPPRVIQQVAPAYTDRAARFRVEGEVRLRVTIDTDGRVEEIEVLEGLPHGLTEQAERAVRKWRFAPGTSGGSPVTASVNVTVSFNR